MKNIVLQLVLFIGISGNLVAQEITLKPDQDPLILNVGETKQLNIAAINPQGEVVQGGTYEYQMLRQEGFVPTSGAQIDSLGNVTGRTPGSYNLIVFRMDPANRSFATSVAKLSSQKPHKS
jgi:hypothetical protein